METTRAVAALSSLAHEGRLAIFRELIKAGPEGLAAGEIGRRLNILPNTLSASLTVLTTSGLTTSRRNGRSVIYSAVYEQMSDLLHFLMEDCCSGSPEVCAPLSRLVREAGSCTPRREPVA